ncbi:DNA/RNA nuclease SfsA [Prochlorococcus marinus]|uniref:Sugar fermentation stimulation protein homolog n=1 Tax=Prochlorococcus marinus (strain MIT 9211) TaxID=93059 RepID=SFSA_PROM4|nr:DNA/RNA nuclease SfsA [Prochlorococcus marinus]A9BDN4.1 RecName: Full=Sugar fermentation stimulation protein homolog [Prochlorococcus marinus str. MIT 9211]ABX08220.1 putative sugar fermentation stimulation protein [Prochlorococcus marinus str. MIT 9211]
MIGKSLLTFSTLNEGILLKRYKRFLADVELDTGHIVTAHCANTGPMTGVLKPGGRVRVRYAPSPSRKLSWSWEQAQVVNQAGNRIWVGVNTALPNKIVRLAIEAGCFREALGEIARIRNEVKYGRTGNSRIDLLLTPGENNCDQRQIFLEIKNTTWTDGSLALFPDTVTERGQKHLQEMIDVLPNARALLVPCISRNDVDLFAPGDAADPIYGNLFRQALSEGVEVMPCCFGFFSDHITWEGMRPFRETQTIFPLP